MSQPILIKLQSNENGCSIRTVCRNHSSRIFYISREEAAEIERKGWGIVRDGLSFAEIRIRKQEDKPQMVQIQFFWAKCRGEDVYEGVRERVFLQYEKFHEAFLNDVFYERCLSKGETQMPKIEFHSNKNLKEVVRYPVLRKRLGRFLARHFQWPGSIKIELYDDFLPYSFGFQEYCRDGSGIAGGVILHGAECIRTAHYSIHT